MSMFGSMFTWSLKNALFTTLNGQGLFYVKVQTFANLPLAIYQGPVLRENTPLSTECSRKHDFGEPG